MGNRLVELRGKESQSSFAAKLGLSQSNYWKYENGKAKLNSDLITKICKTCNCSAEWLLGLSDVREHSQAIQLTKEEMCLIQLYRSFSDSGKEKVIDYVRLIGKSGEYQKQKSGDPAIQNARTA